MQELNRAPSEDVKRNLRREVRFSCPVLQTNGKPCGCPYLTWHHFDPPWEIMKHHNPEGMIALCPKHHSLADGGRYTNDELQAFKASAKNRDIEFDREDTLGWMRYDLLAVVGGNFYYKSPTLLQYHRKPVIWFERDEQGYLLTNIDLSPLTSQRRLSMSKNDWGMDIGNPSDFKCSSQGKEIEACYDNGDKIRLEFVEITSGSHFLRRYNYIKKKAQNISEKASKNMWAPFSMNNRNFPSLDIFTAITSSVTFPVTAVELHLNIKEINLKYSPDVTHVKGNTLCCNFFAGGRFLDIDPHHMATGLSRGGMAI